MKAIVKNKQGVALEDRVIPQLQDENSILIKVAVAGLCRTDSYAAQGHIPIKDSVILGHEFSGTIEKMGRAVEGFVLGDRVSVMPVRSDGFQFSMLGLDLDGAFADYIVVPVDSVFSIPDHVTFQQAAYLEPIAASLAVTKAAIHPDQTGLIYGDNRIAELTLRILRLKGFQKVDFCAHANAPDLSSNTYDFIIETLPLQDAFETMLRVVKPGGTIVFKSRFRSVTLPIHKIVQKEIKMEGVHYGDFQEGIDLLAQGKLNTQDLFGAIYPLKEAVPILLGQQTVREDKKIFFKP